jgi:hypothetical protein
MSGIGRQPDDASLAERIICILFKFLDATNNA